MQPVSIVGCGYTGLKLARRWLAAGAAVRGFATRPESLREIAASGAQGVALDLDAAPARHDCSAHLVYYCVPPPSAGVADPRLGRFLDGIQGTPWRLVYLSTTGVYGDCRGALVDEDTPPAPATERAQRRLAAEAAVRAWSERRAVPWCILRVAGIYGPGRLPLERLRRRTPAVAPPEDAPSNRIHVDDLVSICMAAGENPRARGRIYNVSDGGDDSQTAFLERVARIAELPRPPLIARAEARRVLPASAWSFLGESRRVDNARMLAELGITLAYADLDAGIRASLTPC